MGYLIWGGLTTLISMAAYKVGRDREKLTKDIDKMELMQENQTLRRQQIKHQWRQEYPE
jgi:hypothetical protein